MTAAVASCSPLWATRILTGTRVSRLVFTNCDSLRTLSAQGFRAAGAAVPAQRPRGRSGVEAADNRPRPQDVRQLCHARRHRQATARSNFRRLSDLCTGSSGGGAVHCRLASPLHHRRGDSHHQLAQARIAGVGRRRQAVSGEPRPASADGFGDSLLHIIDGSSTYVMLDRPAETAEAIRAFVNGAEQ